MGSVTSATTTVRHDARRVGYGTDAQITEASGYGDFLSFAIPALLPIQITFGGTLYVSELLLLAVAPFLLISHRAELSHPLARRFLQFGLLWFAGQAVTDVLRSTPPGLLAKGWALILFTTSDFAALWMLVRGRRRVLLALWGSVLGVVLVYLFTPDPFASVYPWKFGYGAAVTLAATLLTLTLRARLTGCLVALLSLSALNLGMGFRSEAGICLAAGAVLGMQALHRSGRVRQITPGRVMATALVLGLAGAGALSVYSSLAQAGDLGQAAQSKYYQQRGRYGPLIGGREDLVFAIAAIEQSPVIGHGSWAQRTPATDEPALSFLQRNGYQYIMPVVLGPESTTIPSHSQVLGAWLSAGVLGLPFWLWFLWTTTRLLSATYTSVAEGCVAALLAMQLIWDGLFSPFGGDARLLTPLYLICLCVLAQRRGSEISRG